MRIAFVGDQVMPRLGMERALGDLVELLAGNLDPRVIVLAGPVNEEHLRESTLGLRPGMTRLIRGAVPLRRALRGFRQKNDLLVGVGLWASIPLVLSQWLRRGARVVVWEHSVLEWRLENEPRLRFAAFVLYRILWRRIDGVVAVTESVRRSVEMLSRGRIPTVVIQNVPPMIPTPRQSPPTSTANGRVSLLGVGSLIPRKNWQLAIRALTHLPRDSRLLIAGEGPSRDSLVRLIELLGLDGRVELLGYRDDVEQLLDQCSVFVHPSYAETYGYSLAEAAAAGKPIVCLDRPVMNEFVPAQYSGAVTSDSSEAFADAIRSAMGHARRTLEPGERAQALVAIRDGWTDLVAGGLPPRS